LNKRTYAVGRPALLAALLFAFVLAVSAACFAVSGAHVLDAALNGRKTAEAAQGRVTRSALKAQMHMEQAHTRVRGWLTVVQREAVSLSTGRGRLTAQLYMPIGNVRQAPWALVLHGGLGSDHTQVMDVACKLSLEGYRVLTPDLYAHGSSDGSVASLGILDAQDVQAWVQWMMMNDRNAQIVIFGQDEGAVAALLAAGDGLPGSVAAIAADSAYISVEKKALELLALVEPAILQQRLFPLAYRLEHGVSLTQGDVARCIEGVQTPLLLIHGTGDEDVLAWQSEDIALAAGENAQLLLVEGAAHGMARFLEPERYYDALMRFFDDNRKEN